MAISLSADQLWRLALSRISQHVNRALNRLAQGNGLQGIHPNVARANIDRRVVKINAEMTYTGRDVDMSALKRSTGCVAGPLKVSCPPFVSF